MSRSHPVLAALRSAEPAVSLRFPRLRRPNEPIAEQQWRPSHPIRNATVCRSPWRQPAFARTKLPFSLRLPSEPLPPHAFLLLLFLVISHQHPLTSADGNGPVHFQLIYLGNACCDNRARFCSSCSRGFGEGRGQCGEIEPVKVIFRAANDGRSSVS